MNSEIHMVEDDMWISYIILTKNRSWITFPELPHKSGYK